LTLTQGRFGHLNDGQHGWDCASAAFESCLAFNNSVQNDLGQYRVVLKDCSELAGVKTSLCNKAYLSLYPPTTSTAPAIAGLIDRDVQILGKTKLSSFLSREEPSEAVDFQTTWNPRGDGYQGPGNSTSGSAAALAAYDWVDVGIGTDSA
jgi:Asp-tRNA(Asn)/Glu-tRNA(Gln) amidotransferase A subunit family amidase